jgi:hypothetical protein
MKQCLNAEAIRRLRSLPDNEPANIPVVNLEVWLRAFWK